MFAALSDVGTQHGSWSGSLSEIASIILIVAVTSGLFAYTVEIRAPWFGVLAESHHQYQSADTLKDAKSWYREGPWNLCFGSFRNPRSVEFPTLESRECYVTYPPGSIVPIYLAGVLKGREPTVPMLMRYNLANHFLIALVLSLTVYLFLRQHGLTAWVSFLFALVPVMLELLLPGPIYWHQSTFFADQAVILPFVLFIFLEVARYSVARTRWLGTVAFLQGAVSFYGFLTDWLFFFVAAAVFGKRIIARELGSGARSWLINSLKYFSGGILAISLYLTQLYLLGGFPQLFERFLRRTGFMKGELPLDLHPEEKFSFGEVFWGHHVPYSFGETAVVLLWASLVLLLAVGSVLGYMAYVKRRLVSERVKSTASLIGMFLLPCFIQVHFLKQHSLIHLFSALKFSVPLAVVPLVLAPVLLLFMAEEFRQGNAHGHYETPRTDSDLRYGAMALLSVALSAAYVYAEHPRVPAMFPKPNLAFDVIGEFISTNTDYNDVVFSPHSAVPEKPPEWLAYTMKRIYRVRSASQIYDKVEGIAGDYVINVFIIDHFEHAVPPDIRELLNRSERIKQNGPLKLYVVPRKK